MYERTQPEYQALYDSLPIAGVDGTIHDRMRKGPAHRRCHAKTGSLIGVSALSGYCTTVSGREVAFSFLMNGISTYYARRLQDPGANFGMLVTSTPYRGFDRPQSHLEARSLAVRGDLACPVGVVRAEPEGDRVSGRARPAHGGLALGVLRRADAAHA